ncbi:MAG: PAS domain S-box protein [Methanoregulaceae archaeon]
MITALYVDDEPDLLEIGKVFLEQSGEFEVVTLTSAEDALPKLSQKKYDAIISDYQMPGMDGIEFLKRVRESGNSVPFIIFTGRGREEIVIQAINAGVDFYLQKGGDPASQFAELENKVRQAVRRSAAERALFESEKRLADIIDFLPDATFAIDTDGQVIAWNRAIEEMTGIPAKDMLGKREYAYAVPFYGKPRPILIDLVFEPDEALSRHYTNIFRSGDAISAETDLPHPRGNKIVVLAKASPLRNQNGDVTGAIESIRDITEWKQAENELRAAYEQLTAAEEELRSQYDDLAEREKLIRESETKFRTIFDNSPYVIMINDRVTGNFISVNPAFLRQSGFSEAEIYAKNFFDLGLVSREEFGQLQAILAQKGKIENIPLTITVKDGTKIHTLFSSLPITIHNKPALLTIGVDVTEQKRNQDALAERERQLDEITSNIPGVVFQFYARSDGSMGFYFVSSYVHDLLGISNDLSDFFPRFMELVHPEDREEFKNSIETAIRNGEDWVFEGRIVKSSGETIWFHGSSSPVHHGTELVYSGVGIDITQQKLTGNALLETEASLSSIFHAVPVGIGLIENRTFLRVNDRLCEITGYSREELLGKNTRFLYLNDEDYICVGKMRAQAQVQDVTDAFETKWRCKDGSVRDIRIHGAVTDRSNPEAPMTFSALDITDEKHVRDELLSAYERLRTTEEELREQYEELAGNREMLRKSGVDLPDDR